MRTYLTVITALLVATVAFGQSERSRRSDRSDRSSRHDRSSRSSGGYSSRSATSQPASFIEEYRLVLDRNIFSKTRVIYREPTSMPSTGRTGSYATQPALALTGVTLEGGVATAFIEDRRYGRTSYYHVGDSVGEGKITAINLDSIELTTNGRVVRVDLGSTVEGGPTYSVSSSSTAGGITPTNSSSTGAAPTGISGDSSDVLEKLRQRRLQETKK